MQATIGAVLLIAWLLSTPLLYRLMRSTIRSRWRPSGFKADLLMLSHIGLLLAAIATLANGLWM